MRKVLQLLNLKVCQESKKNSMSDNYMYKLLGNEALPECSVAVGKGNLIPDDRMQHLLIAFSFSKIVDIQVCETVSQEKL